jgi:hypothetical protein
MMMMIMSHDDPMLLITYPREAPRKNINSFFFESDLIAPENIVS